MLITKLKEKISINNIDEAIGLIEEIGEKKLNEAIPYLIEQLESTENHLLRNTIALALSDIGNQDAVEPIINMLKHPRTKGYRGTLLAALEPFDYSPHIDMLVDFLIEGNFEVSRKSLLLIELLVENVSDEKKKEYIEKIRDEMENLKDKIELLSEAIDIL